MGAHSLRQEPMDEEVRGWAEASMSEDLEIKMKSCTAKEMPHTPELNPWCQFASGMKNI